MAVVAPSNIPLHSSFTGSAGTTYPSGWAAGIYSGEADWRLDGSGNARASAAGWRCMATTTGFARGASPGGIIIEFSTLPVTGKLAFAYLLNDKTADSADGYVLRWDPGNDFQLQLISGGSSSYLDGKGQVDLTGTVAAGFKMAIMVDSSAVTAYCSTDGGTTWQLLGTSTNTAKTGTMYGGFEANATSTSVPKITNVWLGLNTVASRLKRWNGSAWVTANLKRHNGSSWVPTALKKLS